MLVVHAAGAEESIKVAGVVLAALADICVAGKVHARNPGIYLETVMPYRLMSRN